MKKLICFILVLLAMSVTVFAGSIPEDLLSQDEAKLFIGTVESYTIVETPNAPYFSIDRITVTPTEKIKGDVVIGVPETYDRCDSAIKPATDTEYMFAYFDENNFYIYEIAERTGDKFSLKNSHFPMVKRLEDYLNDGSYAEVERKRQNSGEQKTFADVSGKERGEIETECNHSSVGVKILVLAVAGVAVVGVGFITWKKFRR